MVALETARRLLIGRCGMHQGMKSQDAIMFYGRYNGTARRRLERRTLSMVGETGFEPATLWSQTRCATRLRYSPTNRRA